MENKKEVTENIEYNSDWIQEELDTAKSDIDFVKKYVLDRKPEPFLIKSSWSMSRLEKIQDRLCSTKKLINEVKLKLKAIQDDIATLNRWRNICPLITHEYILKIKDDFFYAKGKLSKVKNDLLFVEASFDEVLKIHYMIQRDCCDTEGKVEGTRERLYDIKECISKEADRLEEKIKEYKQTASSFLDLLLEKLSKDMSK